MAGLTIVAVDDFTEDGQRWRSLRLSDGTTVQILLTAPWLILPAEPA